MQNKEPLTQPKTQFEDEAKKKGFRFVAGVDEAGRGPLAGPVVAAACYIPYGLIIPGIDDSKKLSATQRESLFQILTEHEEIRYGIGIVDADVIDQVNILEATKLAMHRAVKNLTIPFDLLLIDGLYLNVEGTLVQKIVHGDALSYLIGAASILAKVTRDRLMAQFDQEYPQYGFKKHKGYGTKAHIEAISAHGPSPIHRKTFEPIKSLVCA